MCLLGGFMIGWVQGIQSIVDNINGEITSVASSIPGLDSTLQTYIQSVIQQNVNPNLGSYWAFGILLAFFGLVLVVRGDRKRKRDGEETTPQSNPTPL
jgi:hypothetical protein